MYVDLHEHEQITAEVGVIEHIDHSFSHRMAMGYVLETTDCLIENPPSSLTMAQQLHCLGSFP